MKEVRERLVRHVQRGQRSVSLYLYVEVCVSLSLSIYLSIWRGPWWEQEQVLGMQRWVCGVAGVDALFACTVDSGVPLRTCVANDLLCASLHL